MDAVVINPPPLINFNIPYLLRYTPKLRKAKPLGVNLVYGSQTSTLISAITVDISITYLSAFLQNV
jgi:hypothetical protein